MQRLLDAAEQAIQQAAGIFTVSGDPEVPDNITEILYGGSTYLVLAHRASAVVSVHELVTNVDTALAANDYRLGNDGVSLQRLDTGTNPQIGWTGQVTVVYTPFDVNAERKVAQIALVQLYLDHHPGIASETIGDWQQSFQSNSVWNYAQERENILDTLRPVTVGFA